MEVLLWWQGRGRPKSLGRPESLSEAIMHESAEYLVFYNTLHGNIAFENKCTPYQKLLQWGQLTANGKWTAI